MKLASGAKKPKSVKKSKSTHLIQHQNKAVFRHFYFFAQPHANSTNLGNWTLPTSAPACRPSLSTHAAATFPLSSSIPTPANAAPTDNPPPRSRVLPRRLLHMIMRTHRTTLSTVPTDRSPGHNFWPISVENIGLERFCSHHPAVILLIIISQHTVEVLICRKCL